MGQFKKAIFIGRTTPDTGFDEYRKLTKLKRISVDIFTQTPNAAKYIPQYDVAFVSRYLTILEALAAGVPVLAHYNNMIKKDYLLMAPFAKFIDVFNNVKDARLEYNWTKISKGKEWARSQTWQKLADMYEQLWQK